MKIGKKDSHKKIQNFSFILRKTSHKEQNFLIIKIISVVLLLIYQE